MNQTKNRKNKKRRIIATSLLLAFFIPLISAGITGVNVTDITTETYSDIWISVSTGGYNLLAEKGKPYEFQVFVKNGMDKQALHNFGLNPVEMPFPINSITPNAMEEIKPMEMVIFKVSLTIPENTAPGKYPIKIDLVCDEFPGGIFALGTEIKVVNRIKTELYLFYSLLMVFILLWLFYRKWKRSQKQQTKK